MKILFLDMDGVINSSNFARRYYKKYHKGIGGFEFFDPNKVKLVNKICIKTDCKIVWSSTWRNYFSDLNKCKQCFDNVGLLSDRLIGCTPCFFSGWSQGGRHSRGGEIRSWISGTEYNLDKCAVLDDGSDAGEFLPTNCKFFQTTNTYGLTKRITDQVIDYLGEK